MPPFLTELKKGDLIGLMKDGSSIKDTAEVLGVSSRAGKKCRLVDNIGARLGSETNFGSHKIKISN